MNVFYHLLSSDFFWWHTTLVATKTRYHGARGAFCARGTIRLSLFLYYELVTRTCLSGSSFISSLPFRLPGGFFPFRDPIYEVHPSLWTLFLSMSMLGVGCGPQVDPFPSRPIMGSIRGEGIPPQTLAVIWRKKGVISLSSGCSRKAGEGVQPPSPPPPPLLAPAMVLLRHHRDIAVLMPPPLPPPPDRCPAIISDSSTSLSIFFSSSSIHRSSSSPAASPRQNSTIPLVSPPHQILHVPPPSSMNFPSHFGITSSSNPVKIPNFSPSPPFFDHLTKPSRAPISNPVPISSSTIPRSTSLIPKKFLPLRPQNFPNSSPCPSPATMRPRRHPFDMLFSCVVKTQRRWSNKIYKTELTKTR